MDKIDGSMCAHAGASALYKQEKRKRIVKRYQREEKEFSGERAAIDQKHSSRSNRKTDTGYSKKGTYKKTLLYA